MPRHRQHSAEPSTAAWPQQRHIGQHWPELQKDRAWATFQAALRYLVQSPAPGEGPAHLASWLFDVRKPLDLESGFLVAGGKATRECHRYFQGRHEERTHTLGSETRRPPPLSPHGIFFKNFKKLFYCFKCF